MLMMLQRCLAGFHRFERRLLDFRGVCMSVGKIDGENAEKLYSEVRYDALDILNHKINVSII